MLVSSRLYWKVANKDRSNKPLALLDFGTPIRLNWFDSVGKHGMRTTKPLRLTITREVGVLRCMVVYMDVRDGTTLYLFVMYASRYWPAHASNARFG